MRVRGAAAILVGAAATLPYLGAIDDYFVQDDFGVVWLLSQKPASAFFGWFVRTWMDDIWGYNPDEIRPFPAVTYQIAALWGAGSPVANHVMNIALHAANAVLVLAIAQSAAGMSRAGAILAGLVFAVLPIHPETVVWVTGRVDSMPAFLYLAAFLAFVRWRGGAGRPWYAAAVVLYFVALFSKQNTVTLPAALVAYDALLAPARPRLAWRSLLPYLPFAVLTAGYLALRYVLFGDVARESVLGAQSGAVFLGLAGRHISRIVTGQPIPPDVVDSLVAPAVLVLSIAFFTTAASRSRVLRVLACFAFVWVVLGVAPTLVAGYESPRHVYLAAVGWSIAVGGLAELVWQARPSRVMRGVAVGAAIALLAAYGVQLRAALGEWHTRAAVSHQAVRDLEQELRQADEGTLIVAGAPVRSWQWALPFAVRPPFMRGDRGTRVHLLWPRPLDCCPDQWHDRSRGALAAWAARPDAPVVVIAWDGETATPFRVSDRGDPFLRSLMRALNETSTLQALEGGIAGALAMARQAGSR